MILNTPTALPARPETARTIATSVPSPQEMIGLTFGNVVLKLLAAIKEEKHAGGKAAIASRYQKNYVIIEQFIDNGADIEITTNDGWTPLMYAVQ